MGDLRHRLEGMRLKWWVNHNSVKMYNKQGSVLRFETTINDPHDLRVYRPKEGGAADDLQWRYLRKGVADIHRRAQVSQAANERLAEAMAGAGDKTPLAALCGRVGRAVKRKGQRARGLNPLDKGDAELLKAISGGQHTLNGFANKDLRQALHGDKPSDKGRARKQSASVTRKVRLLRAHGLIRKLPRRNRYQLTHKGRQIVTALLAARAADTATLAAAA